MGLNVQNLAEQLNLPIDQLTIKLKNLGIKDQVDLETELSEDELKRLYTLMTKTKNDTIDTKEKKSLNYMDFVIEQSEIIFIDTSSLLQEKSEQFLKQLLSMLKKHKKKLILPYKVYEELEKHRHNKEKRELNLLATKALIQLVEMQKNGYLEIYGDHSLDNFADNVFNTQITRLRIKHSILLITNDIKLGKDILALNNSQSVKGKTIHVQKVDRFGFFQKIKLMTENQHHSPKPEEWNRVADHEKFKLAATLTPVQNRAIHLTKEVHEGDFLYTDSKTRIHLKKQIGSGGEGSVFLTDDVNVVAKIYKREKLTIEKYEKLQLMVSKKVHFNGICYPIDILYNDLHEFVGYTMPIAKGKELRHFLFVPKKVFEQRNPTWTRKDLVKLTITILEKIAFLHKRNIILGDINPFNVLVVSSSEVYFVDVDSYQIEGFPCPVGTDNFTAPEIQGKNFKDFLRSFGNEYFAVATLLFSILFLGKSPYSQTGGESNADNIKNMDFPYTFGHEERADNTPKGQWRYIWSNLPYKVKEAFYQTFQKGQLHSLETNRLTAEAWLHIMKKYYKDLDSGKLLQQDEIANEIFPNRFKMFGDSRKDLQECQICHQSFPKWQLTKSICRSCLYKGEEYECSRCGKELIFTNYEKYIRKMTKRFEHCKDCNAHYNSVYQYSRCSDCGTQFSLTYRDKEFFDSKGFSYPKRCPDCRRQNKQGANKPPVYEPPVNHRTRTSEKSGRWCFLTTAACEYYGLPDTCYELEALRGYRDNWLSKQPDGPILIQQYYKEAPIIVSFIKESPNYHDICEKMMHHYILPCVQLIEQGQFEKCKDLYIELFEKLSLLTRGNL